MGERNVIKAALLGAGTVGSGVYALAEMLKDEMFQKTGASLEIKKVLVRNTKKDRPGIPKEIMTDNWQEILEDEEIQLVIELMGGGDRVGIYFLEKGASQRPSKVIYDRAHSAISEATPEDFDWAKIFEGADWFHFTGITPALNDTVAAICLEACKKAKELGITVSCDLNYRNKLWTKAKAGEVMGELCKYVDVCIANEEDASDVFGIKASNTDVTKGAVNHEGYKDVAKQLADRFGFQKVAITLRESISANDNNWSAMLYDGKDYYFSKKYAMHIVDRVGGGDSFGGGLIYACLSDMDAQSIIEFAVAASCLKHSIEGDMNMVSVDEVKKLAGGDGSGRVQR